MMMKKLVLVGALTILYCAKSELAVAQSTGSLAQGLIQTIAGTSSGFSGDGGPGTSAQISLPHGLAVDPSGNLFIADTGNDRIRKVTPDGVISTFAGTGTSGFSGDGGPATAARLWMPEDVAVDLVGNVYIADRRNHRIRKVSPSGTITTVAGNGTLGYGGDGGPATAAALLDPFGVAVDAWGNIFIADTGNSRIRQVDGTGTISTVAGTAIAGYSGDGGPANQARLSGVYDVVVAAAGDIYIADRGNNRVRRVGTNGIISTVAGNGASGATGNGGPATAASVTPWALALDGMGNLFIGQSFERVVRRVDSAGIITAVAGLPNSGFNGDGGPAISANLGDVDGLAFDVYGRLFIADNGFHRIRRVTPDTGVPTVTSVAPASAGQWTTAAATISGYRLTAPTAVIFSGTGVAAVIGGGGTDTLLPITITVASNAAPGPREITVVTAAGSSEPFGGFSVTAASGPPPPVLTSISRVSGIAGTTTRALLMGSNLDQASTVTFSGAGVTGVLIPDGASNSSVTVNITVDAGAAAGARTITVTTPNGTSAGFAGFSVIAASGEYAARTLAGTGSTGYSGDGGPAATAQLRRVSSLARDRQGNVFVADRDNHRIRRITPLGVITTVAGTGTAGFSGDEGPAASAQLNGPEAVAFDAAGNLYIADAANNRVRMIDSSGVIHSVVGSGIQGFSGDGGQAASANITVPPIWRLTWPATCSWLAAAACVRWTSPV
ncbi:MAG TPA: hypothetical protein VFY29_20890 [Terriglobia bacterium]|nr:hypothetical protein [Terriglobia bacterium]